MPVDANGDGSVDGGMTPVLTAAQFVSSLDNDCNGPLKIAIYDQQLAPGVAPNPNTAGTIQFDCADYAANGGTGGQATIQMYVYAIDGAGNYDYCETYLLLQDPNGLCAPGGSISGAIRTEQSQAVQGVQVSLSGSGNGQQVTGANGTYAFNSLQSGGDYTVTPYLDANPLNGVTTFDLVLISKHILNVQQLGSPYRMIAADVNRSSTITTLDLIQLRRLILNIDTQFTNNTSWRFVSAAYTFPVPTNPWFAPFPEVANYNNLTSEVLNANFVGVKVGDVNGSAAANLLASEERSLNGMFTFDVADAAVKAGNVYTVDFRAGEIAKIQGYQATIQLSGAELVDVVYGAAKEENFGLRFAAEGAITTSWNGEASADEVLFSLVIRAAADAQLSDVVGISSRYTTAEAYNNNDETMGVGIQFSTGVVASAGFEVYQNTPNPFKGETMISFNLPVDGDATVTINDVTGRVLTVLFVDGAAGRNMVNVTRDMLKGATGVLSYTVTAGEFTATKKMVVAE
jgi:hypothetical protein